MNELLREIEEDIRAERLQNFWSKFGKQAVWVSVAIVVGTAAGVIWREFQQDKAAKETSHLIAGNQKLEAGDYQAALEELSKIPASETSARYAMSLLKKAEAERASGDHAAAEKTLATLAAMNRSPDVALFVDLARVSSADTSRPVDKDSPLALTLAEKKAWALVAENKKEEAAGYFAELYHDTKTPPSMRARVRLALQSMAPEKLAGGK
ncbi:MAG: tetratricopeptide repeat protein [Alphaproteobacteria bacterium]|nr:tetratricopeptide repeat protein [Alphaproteobacteria bacterium]